MQVELLKADFLLNKVVEFMLLKQEFWPLDSVNPTNSLSKALSTGLFGTNCYFGQIDDFLVERARIRSCSSKIRSYVGDPVAYLLDYLNNPTSDDYYRIRIEIFCLLFGVCVKLYTHTGFKFSSEKFCIQNIRKIRLYKTPKKDYVSIMPIKAKSIFNWSKNLIREIVDKAVFGNEQQGNKRASKRKQQMLVRETGNQQLTHEFKYIANFPDYLSLIRSQNGNLASERGLQSSSKGLETTPFLSSISQDNIQMVRGLGARNVLKSTKAVVSRDLPSEALDYGSISKPFEQFLSHCQNIDDSENRQRHERSISSHQNHGNSCESRFGQQNQEMLPNEIRHSSAEKIHHVAVKPNESSNSYLRKGIDFKAFPSPISSNRSGMNSVNGVETEIKEQRRLLRIFDYMEEEDQSKVSPPPTSLLSNAVVVPQQLISQAMSSSMQELPLTPQAAPKDEIATKSMDDLSERKPSEVSQEPLEEVPQQVHFQKKPYTEKVSTTSPLQTPQPKKKNKKKANDRQTAQNARYKEKIDSQFFIGNLKFYDPSTDFGFITTFFDGNFHDIFAHKDELAKAGLLQSALTFHKTGEVLTIRFHIAIYFGKYKQSKKAVNLERVDGSAQSTAFQSLVNTKTNVNFV
jgi:hypothetical protein